MRAREFTQEGWRDIVNWGRNVINQSDRDAPIVMMTNPRNQGAVTNTGRGMRIQDFPLRMVPVEQLRPWEPMTKMRDLPSQRTVASLRQALQQGDKIPPLLVTPVRGGYRIIDGHHRYAALLQTGVEQAPVRVVDPRLIRYSDEVMEALRTTLRRYGDLGAPAMAESPGFDREPLYHATLKAFEPSIRKHGLLPGGNLRMFDWSDRRYVYLSNYPDIASSFIDPGVIEPNTEHEQQILELMKQGGVIFKIDQNKLNRRLLSADPHWMRDNDTGEETYIYSGAIPPSAILGREYFSIDGSAGGVAEDADRIDKKLVDYLGLKISLKPSNHTVAVDAFDATGGKQVGQVVFNIEDNGQLEAADLEVAEKYRGQGVARAMYDFVKAQGYTINRSWSQTAAGADFWDKYRGQERVWEQGVAEGWLNEASSDEAWELVGQPVPEIQQFVKQMGYGYDEQSVEKLTTIIDSVPSTQISAANISKLKNLANKGNDVQTLKAVQLISGKPDAEQQYIKLMQARDAGEGRNRDVSGYIQYVKSGNYDPPVLLKLPTGVYVIGGRTRLYAALALGVPANVKIISANNFKQGVAEGRVINTHLWHGSRNKHLVLEPRQAVDTGGAPGSNQNAIYATADPKIAIAMGLTTAGSDTGMFPNDPQMVLFSGKIRKGENVYLHRLPMNGPDGKPQFVQGGNSREFHSVPGVKGIEPTEIKAVPVNKYLNLIRKATREDWALRKKFMKKQDVREVVKMPPTKNSSQGMADWAYQDAQDKKAPLKDSLKGIPTEVYDMEDHLRVFVKDDQGPVLYLALHKFLDGFKSGAVAVEPRGRGKNLAVRVYQAASDTFGRPIYSDTTQTDASRIGIWQKLMTTLPDRVVGYDQRTQEDLPLTATDQGPAVRGNQPVYTQRTAKDLAKPVTSQNRSRTRLLKLLPKDGPTCDFASMATRRVPSRTTRRSHSFVGRKNPGSSTAFFLNTYFSEIPESVISSVKSPMKPPSVLRRSRHCAAPDPPSRSPSVCPSAPVGSSSNGIHLLNGLFYFIGNESC